MNVNNVKKPQKRFVTKYLREFNLQGYGDHNIYPQTISAVIEGSPVGAACLDRYITFIEGNGFDNTEFSKFVCNRFGDTVDDILHLVAIDMGKYHGFALHVNYDAVGRIVELQHVHFEDCRLEEEDDNGYVAHIAIHPDWSESKTRSGNRLKINKSNVKKIFPFNPKREVVLNQIAFCGGIENYCGQIIWFSMAGRNQYPKPIYDNVVTSLSTDEGIDNVLYRNVRNNFMPAGALIHKKGTAVGVDDDGRAIDMRDENDEMFGDALNTFLGDTNAASIMDITYQNEEDKPSFINFKGNNYDSEYNSTQSIITAKIYSAFQQEAWYLLSIGKIGFGGDVISDAYKLYNSVVSKERRSISRVFEHIFSLWTIEDNLPVISNYDIQPLVWVDETKTATV